MFKNFKRGLSYAGILSSVSLIAVCLVFNIENRNLKNNEYPGGNGEQQGKRTTGRAFAHNTRY